MRCSALLVVLTAITCAAALAALSPAEREARLLAQVRAQGASVAENLWQLALVREDLGKFALAADTWGLLRQRHGDAPAFSQGSGPGTTWGQTAEFWIARLQRKQRLEVRPPQPTSAQTRRAMGAMIHEAGYVCYGRRDGQVDLLVQADLDGDRRDELLVAGKYGPFGQRDERFICLLRWAGGAWQVFARWDESELTIFPYGFEVADLDGDGWSEVRTFFEPDSDNVGTIRSNGQAALWWH